MSTAASFKVRDDGYAIATWAGLAAGETGQAVVVGSSTPKTVQLEGTFGGGTVAIQGSINGSNWHTMSSVEIAAGIYVLLTGLSAPTLATIIENPLYMRPVVTGGDGTTALTVYIGYSARN